MEVNHHRNACKSRSRRRWVLLGLPASAGLALLLLLLGTGEDDQGGVLQPDPADTSGQAAVTGLDVRHQADPQARVPQIAPARQGIVRGSLRLLGAGQAARRPGSKDAPREATLRVRVTGRGDLVAQEVSSDTEFEMHYPIGEAYASGGSPFLRAEAQGFRPVEIALMSDTADVGEVVLVPATIYRGVVRGVKPTPAGVVLELVGGGAVLGRSRPTEADGSFEIDLASTELSHWSAQVLMNYILRAHREDVTYRHVPASPLGLTSKHEVVLTNGARCVIRFVEDGSGKPAIGRKVEWRPARQENMRIRFGPHYARCETLTADADGCVYPAWEERLDRISVRVDAPQHRRLTFLLRREDLSEQGLLELRLPDAPLQLTFVPRYDGSAQAVKSCRLTAYLFPDRESRPGDYWVLPTDPDAGASRVLYLGTAGFDPATLDMDILWRAHYESPTGAPLRALGKSVGTVSSGGIRFPVDLPVAARFLDTLWLSIRTADGRPTPIPNRVSVVARKRDGSFREWSGRCADASAHQTEDGLWVWPIEGIPDPERAGLDRFSPLQTWAVVALSGGALVRIPVDLHAWSRAYEFDTPLELRLPVPDKPRTFRILLPGGKQPAPGVELCTLPEDLAPVGYTMTQYAVADASGRVILPHLQKDAQYVSIAVDPRTGAMGEARHATSGEEAITITLVGTEPFRTHARLAGGAQPAQLSAYLVTRLRTPYRVPCTWNSENGEVVAARGVPLEFYDLDVSARDKSSGIADMPRDYKLVIPATKAVNKTVTVPRR